MDEWRLESEPFTFIVDVLGNVSAEFEGFSMAEDEGLDSAIEDTLSSKRPQDFAGIKPFKSRPYPLDPLAMSLCYSLCGRVPLAITFQNPSQMGSCSL
ncbi:MAG: hypothetical protein ABID84_01870 [Chloroflexota bacterium]